MNKEQVRDTLAAAATAAGYAFKQPPEATYLMVKRGVGNDESWELWDPIGITADAAVLMTSLKIDVTFSTTVVIASTLDIVVEELVCHKDKLGAWRRAVTQAAAMRHRRGYSHADR